MNSKQIPDTKMHLSIAAVPEIRRDLRKNSRWILGLAGVVAAYIAAMAGVIKLPEQWSYPRALYFTVINMTTVGFGDVVPHTHIGKIVAGVNAFSGLLLFGLIVAVVSLALQPASVSVDVTSQGLANAPVVPGSPSPRQVVLDFVRILNDALRSEAKASRDVVEPDDIRIEAHILKHDGHAHLDIKILLRSERAS